MSRHRVILGGLATFALILFGGVAAAVTAAPTPAPEVLSITKRDWCIQRNTGIPQNLWLVAATNKCQRGYWGPVTLGSGTGIAGPVGPKGEPGPVGPKGEPGTSAVVVASGQTVVTADATYSVTVAGLPKLTPSQLKSALALVNLDALAATPADAAVPVTASIDGVPTADAAGTAWTFKVKLAGSKAGTTSTLKVNVVTAQI